MQVYEGHKKIRHIAQNFIAGFISEDVFFNFVVADKPDTVHNSIARKSTLPRGACNYTQYVQMSRK